LLNGSNGDLGLNMTRPDSHDANNRSPIQQSQGPEVCIMRQDHPSKALRFI